MEINEAIEVWRSLKDYIPSKDRQSAADQFVVALIDTDLPTDDLWTLADIDQYLENAVKENMDDYESTDKLGDNELEESDWDD